MSLAVEAELGALYINAHTAAKIQKILLKMGHLQPKTPMQTDNLTAVGILGNTILPNVTKVMDMRFH